MSKTPKTSINLPSAKSMNQGTNPHVLGTFKINADDNDCFLSKTGLEIGNSVYYPKISVN